MSDLQPIIITCTLSLIKLEQDRFIVAVNVFIWSIYLAYYVLTNTDLHLGLIHLHVVISKNAFCFGLCLQNQVYVISSICRLSGVRWRYKLLSMKTRRSIRSLKKKQTCQPHNKNGAAWRGIVCRDKEVETLLILLNIALKCKVIKAKNAFWCF